MTRENCGRLHAFAGIEKARRGAPFRRSEAPYQRAGAGGWPPWGWLSSFLRASSARFCSSSCSFFCCSSNTFGSVGGPSFALAKSVSGNGKLMALPAHFLHSSGNHQIYDPESRILYSGDLGASVGHSYIEVEYASSTYSGVFSYALRPKNLAAVLGTILRLWWQVHFGGGRR